LSGGTGALDKRGKRMMRAFRRQRARNIMNNVLLATAPAVFAAYATPGVLLSKNNTILTVNLLAWLLGDDILDLASGKSRAARGAATFLSYTAPVGNALTAYAVFRKTYGVRLLSGVQAIPAAGSFVVDLTAKVKKPYVDELKKKTNQDLVIL